MIDIRLLPDQRQVLFDRIVLNGLDPANFRLEEREAREVVGRYYQKFRGDYMLYLPQPEFCFGFGGVRVQWSPSRTVRNESREHDGDFAIKNACFQMWLSPLVVQIGIPAPRNHLS